MPIRVRFAPSPTGIPHIGNTHTALFNYLFAKHNRGKFIVRIEDTDQSRLIPGSLEKILQILKIVGINWDEGPEVGGPYAPYIQSQRLKIYQDHAQALVKKGAAYRCYCSLERLEKMRAFQQQHKKLPKYDRHCLGLPPKKSPYVIRLKVPQSGQTGWRDLIQKDIKFQNNLLDDQVLLKSDGYPTYHLAVVIDDYLMKISHILRGVEWISSTPKHILLYQAFGWPLPQIGHFPVILGPDKTKLSKRHGAKSILDYQTEGYLPEALVTFMAYLGWSYQDNSQLLTMDQLIDLFDLNKVQVANPIFDLQKLDYFNAKLIRQTPPKALLQLIKPYLKLKMSDNQLAEIIPLIQERLFKLGEINDLIEYFIASPEISPAAILTEAKMDKTATAQYLNQVIQAIEAVKFWTVKNLETDLHQLQQKLNLQPRQAFMTLRLAVTGRPATPPLFDVLQILGKDEVIKRLHYAQEILT